MESLASGTKDIKQVSKGLLDVHELHESRLAANRSTERKQYEQRLVRCLLAAPRPAGDSAHLVSAGPHGSGEQICFNGVDIA